MFAVIQSVEEFSARQIGILDPKCLTTTQFPLCIADTPPSHVGQDPWHVNKPGTAGKQAEEQIIIHGALIFLIKQTEPIVTTTVEKYRGVIDRHFVPEMVMITFYDKIPVFIFPKLKVAVSDIKAFYPADYLFYGILFIPVVCVDDPDDLALRQVDTFIESVADTLVFPADN